MCVGTQQVYSAYSLKQKMLVWFLMNGGGMHCYKFHTRTGEQLWDSWSGETGFQDRILWVYLFLDVCVWVRVGHNLALARYWSHSLAAQLCIKQCSFHMTWWQYSGFSSRWPLWGAHLLTLGASQPPTHYCLLVPWLAAHLVLRGAGIIPQELIAHLITVGNTWPFLQVEEDEEEGQKKKRAERREQKRENKWGNMS